MKNQFLFGSITIKHKIPLLLLFGFSLILLFQGCSTDPSTRVKSPDGKIMVKFRVAEDKKARYEIYHEDSIIIINSELGIIRDDAGFYENLNLVSVSPVKKVHDQYTMLHGKQQEITYNANRKVFRLENVSGKRMDVIFQVSNDGVAFRYVFPGDSEQIKEITEEKTRFGFKPGTHTWIQPLATPKSGWSSTNPSYEEHYIKDTDITNLPDKPFGWVFPALFNSNGYWILLSETAPNHDYCGSRLSHDTTSNSVGISLATSKEVIPGNRAKPASTLPWNTPWRIIAIGKELSTIVESTLGTDLAKPAIPGDFSFVQPGRASWSWALLKDNPVVYDIQKRFVDYAADMGWEYCLVDVNWDRNIGYDSIRVLADYARKNGVGLLLWYNSAGDWNTTPYTPKNKLLSHESRMEEFSRLKKMGIKGIKVDFFAGDGQSVMSYYQDIFEDAAEYNLMVNCHGTTLPRGWQRTYPNLVTMESVRGFEYVTFEQENADLQPEKSCVLPFTRNVFDPMDFTPVCFSEIPGIQRRTSNAFELALAVMFHSGIQNYAETPSGMDKVPEYVKNTLREIPVGWEQTKFVTGFPGELVVLARKKGEVWYVSGINGKNKEKDISLHLPFITNKTGFIITDGRDKRTFVQKPVTLPDDKRLSLKISGYGGFLIYFEEEKEQ